MSILEHLYLITSFFGIMDTEARFSPTLERIRAKKRVKPYFGAHGEEETPVLIPNTEVKLFSGDYTAQVGN